MLSPAQTRTNNNKCHSCHRRMRNALHFCLVVVVGSTPRYIIIRRGLSSLAWLGQPWIAPHISDISLDNNPSTPPLGVLVKLVTQQLDSWGSTGPHASNRITPPCHSTLLEGDCLEGELPRQRPDYFSLLSEINPGL